MYLQPTGFFSIFSEPGEDSSFFSIPEWVQEGAAFLPLAGGGLCFSAVRILERGRKGQMCSRYQSVEALLREKPEEALPILEKIASPRRTLRDQPLNRPLIMGIVNATPDSFSDPRGNNTAESVISDARRLCTEGADILDIGGESTRPGACTISVEEELDRLTPVLTALQTGSVPISVDTRKSEVMEKAITLGAEIINDVSGFRYDPLSLKSVASRECWVVLVHSRGEPETGWKGEDWEHVVLDVYDELQEQISVLENAGIARERVIVDPGIGFGKTPEENLCLLRYLSLFHGLGVPLMLGVSRKGTLGRITGEDSPAARLAGSLSVGVTAFAQGIQILRVHDVAATRQALHAWRAVTCGCPFLSEWGEDEGVAFS